MSRLRYAAGQLAHSNSDSNRIRNDDRKIPASVSIIESSGLPGNFAGRTEVGRRWQFSNARINPVLGGARFRRPVSERHIRRGSRRHKIYVEGTGSRNGLKEMYRYWDRTGFPLSNMADLPEQNRSS